MKFVIRDDDLNFFTKPDDIERWYGDIFTKNIPVAFSAIPFVGPSSDVYPWVISNDRVEYPINDNQELISYIKAQPLIEIVQHGCTHKKVNGIFEYQQQKDLVNDTIRGKQMLEYAIGSPVTVFVPPHDQISNQGIHAIEKANLNIIRSKGSKNFLPRLQYVFVFLKMIFHYSIFIFRKQEKRPAYPYTVNLGKHQEAFSFRIELGFENLKEALKYIEKKKGNFVVVLHLHSINEETKTTLLKLLAEAEKRGFEFVQPHLLFSKSS